MRSLVVFSFTVLAVSGVIACGSDGDGGATADAIGDTMTPDADQDTGELGEDTTAPADTDPGLDTAPGDVTEPGPPTLVEIVAPFDQASVRDVITVELHPVGREELRVDFVHLRVNGFTVRQDTKLPTEFLLDTRAHGTGPLTLEAVAQSGFTAGSHAVVVYPNNPPMTFVRVMPEQAVVRNGQVVSVVVGLTGPPEVGLHADFSAIDSGYVPGSEYAYPIGGGLWAISYVVTGTNTRLDGDYSVPLLATAGPWEVAYDQLDMRLQNRAGTPLRVRGGIFVDDALPQPSGDWTGATPSVTGDGAYIVTGGASALTVNFGSHDRLDEVTGLIVGLEGHAGHFHVPIDPAEATAGVEVLSVFLRAFATYEATPQLLVTRVALRDVRGRISPYGNHIFQVTPVGTGDIQATLSWDTPADLDLYVVDPFGCEIYYGNRSCPSGGELDLDSNAGCGGADVRAENVFWPAGQAPVGNYTVRVNHWSNCSAGTTNWSVTVNACGRTEVFEGGFLGGTATGGGSGAGQVVTTFSNANCQTSVRGRVRYQDRPFNERGFGALTWRPVRNAVVELRRIADGEVLGSATTSQSGDYDIRFTNDGPPGLVIVVKAMTDPEEGLRDIVVLDHPKFSKLYEVSSPPVVFDPGQEERIVDIDIPIELNAGAFNIFDVFQEGYDLIRRMTGRELGSLVGFWATGTDTTETLYCSRYLYDQGICTDLGSVSVQGRDSDRDEYDDMVILREFFRFGLTQASADSHPGGQGDGTRDDPTRAWTEGVTTFFANDVSASAYFVDSRPSGVYLVDDIEEMPSPFAYGTSDGTMTGDLSPMLVAAVLWDLADGPDLEPHDTVVGMQAGIYDTLFNYFPSDRYIDRGAPGIDLVDFLDGWFCRGWGHREGVEAILDHHGFPYDFAGPSGCDQL